MLARSKGWFVVPGGNFQLFDVDFHDLILTSNSAKSMFLAEKTSKEVGPKLLCFFSMYCPKKSSPSLDIACERLDSGQGTTILE